MAAINERINELLKKHFNGNNSKFADFIGTSEANIRNYCRNTEPKVEFINTLVSKLDISYEWLLAGEGDGSGQDASTMKELYVQDSKIPHCQSMTTDERFDALLMQNNILSEANITLAKAAQEATRASQDAIKMAHDSISANQRLGEMNQEMMKQLLAMLGDVKKNSRAGGAVVAVGGRTAVGQ